MRVLKFGGSSLGTPERIREVGRIVLQSVNGLEITSPDKALEVYTKVRSASSLSLSVLRRGLGVNMEYSIK